MISLVLTSFASLQNVTGLRLLLRLEMRHSRHSVPGSYTAVATKMIAASVRKGQCGDVKGRCRVVSTYSGTRELISQPDQITHQLRRKEPRTYNYLYMIPPLATTTPRPNPLPPIPLPPTHKTSPTSWAEIRQGSLH